MSDLSKAIMSGGATFLIMFCIGAGLGYLGGSVLSFGFTAITLALLLAAVAAVVLVCIAMLAREEDGHDSRH